MNQKNSVIHLCIYIVCFISCLFPPLLFVSSAFALEKNPQKKLLLVKQELIQINQNLKKSKIERSQHVKKIQAFDIAIANLSQQLKTNQSAKKTTEISIKAFKNRGSELTKKMTENRENLAKMTRALYEMGDKNYLKIMLNQSDASEQSRMLDYFDYFSQAFTDKVAQLNNDMSDIQKLEAALAQKLTEYDSMVASLKKETDLLDAKRQNKKAYLAALERKMRAKKERLRSLKSSRLTLEKLLKALKKRKHREEMARLSGMSFAKNKGKLKWPVAGKVQYRYGQRRANSGLKWRGLLISAKAGEKVKAIEGGTIVFADWLSGYGFVLIIDHSKGYMSLYGHNQQLLKDVADKVKAGDVIAEAGNSGRLGKPGLYFEIRRNGKPINPKKWLTARKSR